MTLLLHYFPFLKGIDIVKITCPVGLIIAFIIRFQTKHTARIKTNALDGFPSVRQQDNPLNAIHHAKAEQRIGILAFVQQITPFVDGECAPCVGSIGADDVRSPIYEMPSIVGGVGRYTCTERHFCAIAAPTEEVNPPVVGIGGIRISLADIVVLLLCQTLSLGARLVL